MRFKIKILLIIFSGSSQEGLAAAATAVLAESALSKPSSRNSSLNKTPTSSTLKFITWNIDGLNEKNIKVRTTAVCKSIEA